MGKSRKASGPRVYSYIRFSTPDQKLGDSERRQIDMARAWAEKKGYAFDEVMNDFGFSAFSGANKEKGALGVFLERVSKGEICEGSILVVEDIDRLSRQEPIDAIETIVFGIIKKGIAIQTVGASEFTYDRAAVNTQAIFLLIAKIQIAFEDSQKKSVRISAARDRARKLAREQGKPLTSRAPAWLQIKKDINNNRTGFDLIKPAKKAINLIFQMRRRGLGTRLIAEKLNEISAWTAPKRSRQKTEGWRDTYVKKILRNRAVIGEYQPHVGRKKDRKPVGEPIKDYYPAVISTELFNAVQALIAGNKKNSGRNGKVSNLFGQMAVCAYCGGPMHPDDKGRRSKFKLVCYNGSRRAKCEPFRIRYDEIESLVLANCKRLRVDEVLPSSKEQEEECLSLREQIAGKQHEMSEAEQEVKEFAKRIGSPKTPDEAKDEYEKLMVEGKAKIAALKKEVAEAERQLSISENGRESFAEWQRDFATMQSAIVGNPEMRLRLRAHLRQLITKIEVFSNGFAKLADGDDPPPRKNPVREHKGRKYVSAVDVSKANRRQAEDLPQQIRGLFQELDPKYARSEEGRAFLADLEKRMLSKDARFLRLWFRSGALMDVVPADSIARGVRLVRDKRGESMEFVSPSLELLLQEFRSKRHRTSSGG